MTNIIATLRPTQGIQCEQSILYLFDQNVANSIVETTTRQWLEDNTQQYIREYIQPMLDAYEQEKEREIDAYVEEKQSTIFFDNTNFTGTTTAEILNITNEENNRYLNFKVNNDIKALVSNTYISNYPSIGSILTLKSIYDENNSSRIELLSQLNKSEIKAYGNFSVIGTGHFYDELTAVDINIQNDKQTKNLIFKNGLNEEKAKIQNAILTNRSILRISCSYDDNLNSNITFNANNSTQETSVFVSGSENETASNSTTSSVIATQGWVNNTNKSLNVVHRSGDEEISGRKDFLNDITAPNQLDYTNISNCITEIPQDIKLELNNGILTLKAGSKLYVPNGAGVFDELVINSDKTVSISSFSGFVFYRSDNNSIHLEALQPTSGTTPPSGDGTWYDTNANKIKRYENSSFVYDGISFPLCKCSSGSIDQVFNGFGYIGSTVFALPGVKGLIPDGRNEDGSLKSIEFINSKVLCWDKIDNKNNDWFFEPNNTSVPLRGWGSNDVYNPVNSPVTSVYSWSYVAPENQWYFCNDSGVLSKSYPLFFGKDTSVTTTISGFKTKTPFHAVDYNDREFIGHQAMPSDRYIDLTLGSSGASYTAPADGYFCLSKEATGTEWVNFINTSSKIQATFMGISGLQTYSFIPVKKKDIVEIFYALGGITNSFRFIYAEGSK